MRQVVFKNRITIIIKAKLDQKKFNKISINQLSKIRMLKCQMRKIFKKCKTLRLSLIKVQKKEEKINKNNILVKN